MSDEHTFEHTLSYFLPHNSIIDPEGVVMYIIPIGEIIRRYDMFPLLRSTLC